MRGRPGAVPRSSALATTSSFAGHTLVIESDEAYRAAMACRLVSQHGRGYCLVID